MTWFNLSADRIIALIIKEFRQMRRDRLTFAMMIGIPIIQLVLFGFAINTDPRHLPAAVNNRDPGPLSRSLLKAMENTTYFRFTRTVSSEEDIDHLLQSGAVSFVVTIPEDFERKLVRGQRPVLRIDADATDPSASSNGLAVLDTLAQSAFRRDLIGPLAARQAGTSPIEVRIHRLYNPAGKSSLNIVPGLLGVILTLTLTLITAVALTRENERGTLEGLLATPVRPLEVMIGKVTPYILVGFIQSAVVLAAAILLFGVPFEGSPILFLIGLTLFVFVNLLLGFLFSTMARSQFEAMQMSVFILLPSILLSGFMFPFKGMPVWAQVVGECLPATHFMRLVRKIMLKGASMPDIVPDIYPLLIILAVTAAAAIARYRTTLD